MFHGGGVRNYQVRTSLAVGIIEGMGDDSQRRIAALEAEIVEADARYQSIMRAGVSEGSPEAVEAGALLDRIIDLEDDLLLELRNATEKAI